MEGKKLEQKSKSTQIPSYLSSDICRYCFKKIMTLEVQLSHTWEEKEKGESGKFLLKDNLKILCPKNLDW